MTISYADIEKAEKAQSDVIRKTSLTFSQTFSNMTGSQVYLKNEYEQKTGSFKIRGAYSKISSLSDDEKNMVLLQHQQVIIHRELHSHHH